MSSNIRQNQEDTKTMRPSPPLLGVIMVSLCLGFLPKCALAQFLDREVQEDLCGIAQQYIDELDSLVNRSGRTSYPAAEAVEIHVRNRIRFWNIFVARCPNCDHRAWLPCSQFVEQLCTAIRRWGESHYPGLLTRPDATEKIRGVLLGYCANLVIPTPRKGDGGSEGKYAQ